MSQPDGTQYLLVVAVSPLLKCLRVNQEAAEDEASFHPPLGCQILDLLDS